MNYLVLDADGKPFSFGTVLANPLPDGFTYVVLSDEEYDLSVNHGYEWDGSSVEPPES